MKTYSFNLTTTQKRRFYSQELFDGQLHLKKSLRLVIIIIGLIELIRVYLVESQRKTITLEGYQKWLASGTATLGSIFFVISTFKIVEKKAFKTINLRALIVFVSCILLAVGTFMKTIWTMRLVIGVNDPEAWLDAFTITVNLAFGMALTDVIFPNCFLKLLLPCAMFIGTFMATMEANTNNQFVLVFRIVTIAIYVVCLYMIKDSFRWKLFLKRIEDETWKALQTKILEEIPTSIAILDLKQGKIAYQNEEFKRWGEDPYNFFKKVANLTKRKQKHDMFKSMDFGSDIDNNSHPSINLDIYPETVRKTRTVDDCLQDSPVHGEFMHNQSMSLFDMVKELCLNHEKKHSKDHWGGAYDGIYSENENHNVSLEIKISFIAQYPTAAIIVINDTTQRDLIVSLESNNKYKDNLLASISHELRTPLNGSLALLESAIQHEEGSKFLKETFLIPALRSGSLLVHIINDILDYSQMGLSTIRLAYQDLPIIQTLKDCYSLMELQAKKKGLKFSLLLHSNIPNNFVTDHSRVKQILLNLIGNAIKFTFDGEIRVEAKMNDKNSLNVSVMDTGIGINSRDIEKIFNKCNQVCQGEKITENSTGVGLGLTVAHRLAKMLGPSDGQGIAIQSELDKGSTFSFSLLKKCLNPKIVLNSFPELDQFKIDNIASPSMNEFSDDVMTPAMLLDRGLKYSFSSQVKASLFGRRNTLPGKSFDDTEPSCVQFPQVLIVDDDPFNVLALESLLKPFRVQTDSAFNGQEAIKKIMQRKELDENNYKLIIMDFNMPVMNGHETTRILKDMMKKGTLPQISIVGCTAFNTNMDIDEGMKSGMSEVMIKPVAKNKLLPVLQRHLGITE